MDYHVNVVFISMQVECEISLDKFMFWCFICLAVINLSEKHILANLTPRPRILLHQ